MPADGGAQVLCLAARSRGLTSPSMRNPLPPAHPDALLAAGLALVMVACSPSNKGGQFSLALAARLQGESRSGQIDLGQISSFAWDELFILAPKSSREDNCRTLGLGWLDCRITFPATIADDEEFLVFRAKQQVIRAERHPRANGDFVPAAGQGALAIARSAARFRIVAAASGQPGPAPRWQLEYDGPAR